MANNFGPASPSETVVFGANRPGYSAKQVGPSEVLAWIDHMKKEGIQRVVCLLRDEQLAFYDSVRDGLLGEYRSAFGDDDVLSAPVKDYHLIDSGRLKTVIDFLGESDAKGRKAVVHCSGGSGRTGHVLAAWLAQGRGYQAQEALQEASKNRNPYEAVQCGNATDEDLIAVVEGKKIGN